MRTVNYTPRHRWDERLHLPAGSVEKIVHGSESWRLAQLGRLPLADYWDDVKRQLQLSAADVTQLALDFYSGDQLDFELVSYIRRLKQDGHPIALLSNDSPALLDKLHTLHISDLFEPLVISAFIGVMKPDARAYQITLNKLKCRADEAVFIDDMPANLTGAAAVGLRTIHYTTVASLQAALQPLLAP